MSIHLAVAFCGASLGMFGVFEVLGISVWGEETESNKAILPNLPKEVTPLPPLPTPKDLVSPSLPDLKEVPVPIDRPITLEEALQVAGKNYPNLIRARLDLEQAKSAVGAAQSLLFPSISVSYNYQTNPLGSFGGIGGSGGGISQGFSALRLAPPADSPTDSQQADKSPETSSAEFDVESFLPRHTMALSVNQLLFDFGRTLNNLSQVKHRYKAMEQRLNAVAGSVINQVKQSYYALLQSQHLVEVQRQNLEGQRSHLKVTQTRFEEKVAPYGDMARAQAAVAEAQSRLVQAQNSAARARVNFNLSLGIDPRTPTQVADLEEPIFPIPSPDELIETAYQRRAEVSQAQENIEMAKKALKSARKANLPSLSGGVSESFRGRKFPPDDSENNFTLRLQWNPFDFGLTRSQVDQGRKLISDLEIALDLVKRSIASEVIQAYQDVQVTQQQVENAAVEVASAQESLRISREKYAAGISTFIEVIDGQTALVAAQTNQVNAKGP